MKDNFKILLFLLILLFLSGFVLGMLVLFAIKRRKYEELEQSLKAEYDTAKEHYENLSEKLREYQKILKTEYDEQLNERTNELIEQYNELTETYKTDVDKRLHNQRLLLENLIAEKKQSCPTLAMVFASYEYAIALNVSNYLKKKPHPAYTAAERVKEFGERNRQIMMQLKEVQFQLQYYESAFPWLEEFKEIDVQEVEQRLKSSGARVDNEYDTLKKWLSPDEYANLSTIEKYQLALDRYKCRSNKTKWEIGIEYERYIGYNFEKDGYNVEYRGALDGLQDMGRDLIATKGNTKYVIQCKYWSVDKTIHEKHIFQLFGTVVLMQLQDTKHDIIGMFVTSAKLSDTAKQIAEKLNIVLYENIPMSYDYPCIKCNINRSTHEWIYHLPFDQQYDRVVILPNTKEKYALTVAEAEYSGFRRASKWHGNSWY